MGQSLLYILIAFLLGTGHAYANDYEYWDKPWDSFVGCYKTLKYKGRNIQDNSDNITVISTDISNFFRSSNSSAFLPILKVITYRGDRGNHPYGYYQAFLDRGQFVKVQDGFNYYVDTTVRYGSTQSGFRRVNYESTLSLQKQGDLVELKVVIRSDQHSDMFLNQSGTYLLKPLNVPGSFWCP